MSTPTATLDPVDADAPIFDPTAFGLTAQQAELGALARELGREKFAPRAFHYDRDALFPTANYRDLHVEWLAGRTRAGARCRLPLGCRCPVGRRPRA